MQDHFRKAHFLCEEGNCVDIQFTSCFRTSIDLKSHKANHHSKGMTSAQMRQMRNIEIDINLTERSGRKCTVMKFSQYYSILPYEYFFLCDVKSLIWFANIAV